MNTPDLQLPGGASLALDEKGYLLEYAAWTPLAAETMAANDGMHLEADHWVVLYLFRDYFEKHEIEPPMRVLVRKTRESLGEEKGNSRYLYRLFPDGPGTQACRYAGLPRPLSCV
ncbi:MAG: TusE/DsrC/DsvC family sulfur relay protein [Xanthomonadales bacterium]|jgi:tRNA 2-thiouridine synthesizing protein E|nr:TusE/DsrC/DsvC family sulfur relay protein [Xanthomonadales bacterium]